jgi:uncharacterized protein YndB with AHSA1/START domain
MSTAAKQPATQETDLVIMREIAAPRSRVWQAFTQVEQLAKWWGPIGLTMESVSLDLRPGGAFHYGMRTPGGEEMWGLFVYREIVPEERIEFVSSFSDATGGLSRHPMAPDWPVEILNRYFFEDLGDRTRMTVRGTPINATPAEVAVFAANHPSMNQGFAGTFKQLDEFLKQG